MHTFGPWAILVWATLTTRCWLDITTQLATETLLTLWAFSLIWALLYTQKNQFLNLNRKYNLLGSY
jgi:hypothetical protein